MQTEIYEVEKLTLNEMNDLANEGEKQMLIEALELDGQRELNTITEVFPFRQITLQERLVFGTLFPKCSSLQSYNSGPIPLDVLQAAERVKKANFAKAQYMEIWHPADVKADPVLVARPSRYQTPIFLIARWGEALLPFEELKEKAKKVLRAEVDSILRKAQVELQGALAVLDSRIEKAIETGEHSMPYINTY